MNAPVYVGIHKGKSKLAVCTKLKMGGKYVGISYTNFEEWVHIISYLKGPNTQTVNQICSVDFIFFDKFQFFKNFLWTLT